MGLDIYCGSVSRYVGGGWSTITQQMGEASGIPVFTVRPGDDLAEVIRRAEASRAQHAGPVEINLGQVGPPRSIEPIAEWKAGIVRRLGLNEEWDDRPDSEYFSDKPGWEGYGAVVLLAAYDEQPALAPGAKVKRLFGSRTVAAVAPGNFGDAEAYKAAYQSPARYPTLLRGAEWCLPVSGGPALFAAATPFGRQVTMGHVDRLLAELQLLNQRTLRLDPEGLKTAARGEIVEPTLDSFESMAPFGLGIITATAEFAAAHHVAWIMDY